MYCSNSFRKCIDHAKNCEGEEAALYYRMAVMLKPENQEGYLGLLQSLSSENKENRSAGSAVEEALRAVEYDRSLTNEETLRACPEEYIPVAYRLGMLLFGNGSSQDEKAAKKYLSYVAEADMESLDLGENDRMKAEWQKRSRNLLQFPLAFSYANEK